MKQLFYLLFLLPFFGYDQNATSSKNLSSSNEGYEINGTITDYDDSPSVSYLNQQTGTPEKQTTIKKGKFTIKGHLAEPSFIVLVFADQPPTVPLFID